MGSEITDDERDFTAEELEFIINYDIKCRMGKTSADEDADAE